METRANYIAVGIFALAAIVSAFVLTYWFGRYSDGNNLAPLDVRIQGSVSGLGAGSPVQFNGINVGRVRTLSLDTDDPRYVIVHTEINKNTPVREDTRASIGIRGLSGGAYIQLDGGSPVAPALLKDPAEDGPTPSISGDPAALVDLLKRVTAIASRTERIMGSLESFVAQNSTNVTDTIGSIQVFSRSLSQNSEGLNRFLQSAGSMSRSLESLSGKLDGTISQVEKIVGAVDPTTVRGAVDNAAAFTKTLSDQQERITAVMSSVSAAAGQLETLSTSLSQTINRVDQVLAAVDPKQVSDAVSNISKAAGQVDSVLSGVDGESVGRTIANAEAFSKTLADQREQISTLIASVNNAATQLGTFSKQITGTLGKVDTIVGAVEPWRVTSVVENFEKAAGRANEVLTSIDEKQVSKTIEDVSTAAANARRIVDGVDQEVVRTLINNLSTASKNVTTLLAAIDAARVNAAIDGFASASAGAQRVVDDVASVTGRFRGRGDDIDSVVTNTSELAARLNESSKKIDGVIERINALLGPNDGSGLVAEARATLTQFRKTARVLDARISEISGSVTSFTRRGLGDTQSLIRDARQSINRIDRVIRNIENNPSALISGAGGSRVRETTSGRPRR